MGPQRDFETPVEPVSNSPLPTSTLGSTGLEVTRLGYGAMAIHGVPPAAQPVSDDHARGVLHAVMDAGISFIDTANCYGRSEEFIGNYLGARRSEYTLATKCGCRPYAEYQRYYLAGKSVPVAERHIWSRENVFRGLEESLRRLRTDYVDLMQVHGPSLADWRREGLFESLDEMRRQGKVRWLGMSARDPEELADFLDLGVFDVFQVPYSAFGRQHEEWISEAARRGVGTVIRGGVAKGEPLEGGATDRWHDAFETRALDELREEGQSRTAFVLRFTLSHPDIHTVIVGSQDPEHIAENAGAARLGPLPADIYLEARRRLEGSQ